MNDRCVQMKRFGKGGCRFTGKPDDRQAIRTVGGDFKFYGYVVQAKYVFDVVAGFAVLLQ